MQQKGLTRRQVWTAIGEKEGAWFERVLKRCLSRFTPKAEDRLKRVAEFFNVNYEDPWRPDLITFEVGKPREAFQDYGEKFADLLASGKHDYLKGLIAPLHGNLWRNVRPEPEPDEPLPPPGQRTWRSEQREV